MIKSYYLAIDIGASSGRCMLGSLNDNQIELKEIHRFKNEMVEIDGSFCWDLNYLYHEILHGLKRCKEVGKTPIKLSIDTWGVDYVLLDRNDEIIDKAYTYRDHRTNSSYIEVMKKLNVQNLYDITGIQTQKFNTIFQLMATKLEKKNTFENVKSFLMIPDYLNFLLTGKKFNEYTNASTTQLMNSISKDWDDKLLNKLGYPKEIFQKILQPGTSIGYISEHVKREIGYTVEVISGASHDTASAVVAVPSNDDDFLYISSGTWSLVGTELKKPNNSLASCEMNFTNEGGYNGTYRYLKNVMGLWIIQEYAKEIETENFGELCNLARESKYFLSRINVNDQRFLSPISMKAEIYNYCMETNQTPPQTIGEFANLIYESLSDAYEKVINEIEMQTNKLYNNVHIVGGGSSATYLNELIVEKTKKKVLAGPKEATAIGNIIIQMMHDQRFCDLKEARDIIRNSFDIVEY